MVTGGSGKAGRAVRARSRRARVRRGQRRLRRRRPDGCGGLPVRAASTSPTSGRRSRRSPASTTRYAARRRGRAPGGDPRAGAGAQRGHVREQHRRDVQRVQRRAADAGIRNVVWASSETVLGLPFDTPPPYVPVDEEYARPAGVGLLARQDARRGDGRALLPVGPGDEDHRAAVLQRHGAAGLRARSRRSTTTPRLRKWNLWGYIDARDAAAGGAAGARERR